MMEVRFHHQFISVGGDWSIGTKKPRAKTLSAQIGWDIAGARLLSEMYESASSMHSASHFLMLLDVPALGSLLHFNEHQNTSLGMYSYYTKASGHVK